MNKKTAFLIFAGGLTAFAVAISHQTFSDLVPTVIALIAGCIAGYQLKK
jgi:hypothetical protein